MDSSESLPLSNLNELAALITCPQTDQNYTILDESGYIHAYLPPSIQFLKGNICRLDLVTIFFMMQVIAVENKSAFCSMVYTHLFYKN